MRSYVVVFAVSALMALAIAGCNSIPGMGEQPPASQPILVQPGQQLPAQPTVPAVPMPVAPAVQPGVAALPGQPAAVAPAQPAAPVAAPTPPAPTGDALTDKINAKKFAIAPEWVATSLLTKQLLEKGKTQAYQVQLPGPPFCQAFVAAGADGIANVDLSLAAPDGTAAAADNTQENVAAIPSFCPTAPGSYTLTVAMPDAAGEFAVQVFSK